MMITSSFVRLSFFSILFFALLALSQPVIELPRQITIYLNDTLYVSSDGWLDSLNQEARSSKISYVIRGSSSSRSAILTQIQIPQIISLKQVLRQIILYYSMIGNEKDRKKEKLNIYHYFQSQRAAPMITAAYEGKGNFYVQVRKWQRIPIPSAPTPEEKAIFNQVLQTAFQEVQTFSSISKSVFNKVALQNGMSAEVIERIYQNITLWQQGQSLGIIPAKN